VERLLIIPINNGIAAAHAFFSPRRFAKYYLKSKSIRTLDMQRIELLTSKKQLFQKHQGTRITELDQSRACVDPKARILLKLLINCGK
jgi:hypothetical protein